MRAAKFLFFFFFRRLGRFRHFPTENGSYFHPFEAVFVAFFLQRGHMRSRANLSLFSRPLGARFPSTVRIRLLIFAGFRLPLGYFLRSREHGFILWEGFG